MVSIRNLWRRKLRTLLTIIGVIIGTTSIVLMMSIGIGVNEGFREQIEQMGSLNTINVSQSYNFEGSGSAEPKKITDEVIDSFNAIPGVEIASPIISVNLKMTAGKLIGQVNVQGIDPLILQAQNVKVKQGRLLEEGDKMSFLFGGNATYMFYDPNDRNGGNMFYGGGSEEPSFDVMTEKLKASYDNNFGEQRQPGDNSRPVKPYKVTAVGVLKEGQSDYDYNIYTTLETAKSIKKEKERYEQSQNPNGGDNGNRRPTDEGYDQAIVQVADMDDVASILETIKGMGYEAWSLTEYLEQLQGTANMIQMVLGGIGAISLVVAAIGITNTMIMSIYERTKEIGVMKVIGAKLKDIKRMFLIEAALIGFFGGVAGLLISFGGSVLLNYVGQNVDMFGGGGGTKLSVIPPWLYLMAISFTTIVGLVSGYLPAVRAMKLSVLNALKTD